MKNPGKKTSEQLAILPTYFLPFPLISSLYRIGKQLFMFLLVNEIQKTFQNYSQDACEKIIFPFLT